MRGLLNAVESAIALLALMFAGSLVLWVGVPLAWLWIGSQVQGATGSLGAALGVMFPGVVASIVVMAGVLGRLAAAHRELRRRRGLDDLGGLPLEITMVVSAGIAVVGFTAWFLLFSGSSPIPIQAGL